MAVARDAEGVAASPHTRPTAATLFFLRWLESPARRQLRKMPQLPGKLERAGNSLVPVAFLARVQGWTLAVVLGALLPFVLALSVAGGWSGLGTGLALPLLLLPVLA